LVKLPDLFLNQTVRSLRAAGSKGGILLIDDLEDLTNRSTRTEIENFVKDFGLAFFRAGNEATNNNFFTIIMTAHEQSVQKISQAWTAAGLSSSFPLIPGDHALVLTRKPDLEQSIDMVVQHLKYYRETSFANINELHPFTKESIDVVISECDFHPRRYLSRFSGITVEAVSKDVKEITIEFVGTVPEVEEQGSAIGKL
jgi:exo-beta-1,3-glucanase (GH17 family)